MKLRLLVLACSVLLYGCSVYQLKPNEELQVDQTGIADDLATKFAVTDAKEATAPAPTPPQAPAKGKHGKKGKAAKGKKGRAAAVEAAKPAYEFKSRRGNALPFSPGERTVMTITYLGVEAGTLDLRVLPYKFIGERKVFHIRGHGLSTSVFSLFYRVNDVGESFMDFDGLFSHKFQLKVDESKQERDIVELYDQKNHQIHFWEKMVHTVKGLRITEFSKPIEEYTEDAVTAAFYLRTLPLEVGKEFTFPMVSNGTPWSVTAKVLRKEDLVTAIGTIPAFVVEPITRFEGVIKQTGRSFIWVSADEHRYFLKIDAKVKIGSVVTYLKELQPGNGMAD